MNEVIVETVGFSIRKHYKFNVRESEWPASSRGGSGKRYDWIEETTDAESDGWFPTREEAVQSLKTYARNWLGLEDY